MAERTGVKRGISTAYIVHNPKCEIYILYTGQQAACRVWALYYL